MITHNFKLCLNCEFQELCAALILVQNLAASSLTVSITLHPITVIATEMNLGTNKTEIHRAVCPVSHPDYQGARTLG